jgi:hypothetical protein
MDPIILKKGIQYVTRSGLVTEPLEDSTNGTNYKFYGWVKEPEYESRTGCSWKVNGRYLHNDIDHRLDIVSEL